MGGRGGVEQAHLRVVHIGLLPSEISLIRIGVPSAGVRGRGISAVLMLVVLLMLAVLGGETFSLSSPPQPATRNGFAVLAASAREPKSVSCV
ncbi:hypothetical protein, partial [Parafrankia sp. BMG5.11]|uniref:hypothetical protein n=1 Tax=Parafrankia sp. BMG5.11 TaxID=222540 RepID=UPI001A9D1CD3